MLHRTLKAFRKDYPPLFRERMLRVLKARAQEETLMRQVKKESLQAYLRFLPWQEHKSRSC